jgi:hypothetical protein
VLSILLVYPSLLSPHALSVSSMLISIDTILSLLVSPALFNLHALPKLTLLFLLLVSLALFIFQPQVLSMLMLFLVSPVLCYSSPKRITSAAAVVVHYFSGN